MGTLVVIVGGVLILLLLGLTTKLVTGGWRWLATPESPVEVESRLMHHDTYMRLFWEHHEAEVEQLAGMRG
jgi:hypothetical protein